MSTLDPIDKIEERIKVLQDINDKSERSRQWADSIKNSKWKWIVCGIVPIVVYFSLSKLKPRFIMVDSKLKYTKLFGYTIGISVVFWLLIAMVVTYYQ